MPDTPTSAPTVTPEELRVLLDIAGLTLSEDRAPAVLAEFNAQLAHGRHIERVLDGTRESTFAPYEPAFPKITLEDDAK
ncbi:MAG: hypothetical protein M3457_14020 [Chloroflexota bacterium]|nr:hypothetical protein [Chloroflexota bacterium]